MSRLSRSAHERPASSYQLYHRHIVPTSDTPRSRKFTPELHAKFGWEELALAGTYDTSSSQYGKFAHTRRLSRIFEKPLPHGKISYMKEHQSRLERDTVGLKRELTTETRDKYYRRIKSATRFDTTNYLTVSKWIPSYSRTDRVNVSIEDYSINRILNPYISISGMDFKIFPRQPNDTLSFWNFNKRL